MRKLWSCARPSGMWWRIAPVDQVVRGGRYLLLVACCLGMASHSFAVRYKGTFLCNWLIKLEDFFPCHEDKEYCVAPHTLCDGRPDCTDGSDEKLCVDAHHDGAHSPLSTTAGPGLAGAAPGLLDLVHAVPRGDTSSVQATPATIYDVGVLVSIIVVGIFIIAIGVFFRRLQQRRLYKQRALRNAQAGFEAGNPEEEIAGTRSRGGGGSEPQRPHASLGLPPVPQSSGGRPPASQAQDSLPPYTDANHNPRRAEAAAARRGTGTTVPQAASNPHKDAPPSYFEAVGTPEVKLPSYDEIFPSNSSDGAGASGLSSHEAASSEASGLPGSTSHVLQLQELRPQQRPSEASEAARARSIATLSASFQRPGRNPFHRDAEAEQMEARERANLEARERAIVEARERERRQRNGQDASEAVAPLQSSTECDV